MQRITDSHAHLDSESLSSFVASLRNMGSSFATGASKTEFRVISNSEDLHSSQKNIELASLLGEKVLIPFVGLHPQLASASYALAQPDEEEIGHMCQKLADLSEYAVGLGEIGLDPKYGNKSLQVRLFEEQIRIAGSRPSMPVCIHTRNTVEEVREILSTFHLKNRVLFHWFAGTEDELRSIQANGYYVSFGPALMYSRRLSKLFQMGNQELVLAETDSPLIFSSMSGSKPLSPFAITSVVLHMALLSHRSFAEMLEVIEQNADGYLRAQNSLRVDQKQLV